MKNARYSMEPLTPRERRFCELYLADPCGTRCYQLAFAKKMTYASARSNACRLLQKPAIKRELDAARRERAMRSAISADKVLREIAYCAFSDVIDLFDDDGSIKTNPLNITHDARRAVKELKIHRVRKTVTKDGQQKTTVTDQLISVELHDKMRALEALSKHLGLDTEISSLESLLAALPQNLVEQLRAAMTRPSGNNGHDEHRVRVVEPVAVEPPALGGD